MRTTIKHRLRAYGPPIALILIFGLWIAQEAAPVPAHASGVPGRGVAGHIVDAHGDAVADASLRLYSGDGPDPLVETTSQPDGAYLLVLPATAAVTSVRVEIERPHFVPVTWIPNPAQMDILLAPDSLLTND